MLWNESAGIGRGRSDAYPILGSTIKEGRGWVPTPSGGGQVGRSACCGHLVCRSLMRWAGTGAGSCTAHSWLSTSCTLAPTFTFGKHQCPLQPGASWTFKRVVCRTCTAISSQLGKEGACWAPGTGADFCWGPTPCPWHCCSCVLPAAMAPAKGTLVHGRDGLVRQVVPAGCCMVAKGLSRASGWAMWQEREGMGPWSSHGGLWSWEKGCFCLEINFPTTHQGRYWIRWCSYQLCTAPKYLLKCLSKQTAIKNLCWWLISVLNYCFAQMSMH